jgi:hypothetical protein
MRLPNGSGPLMPPTAVPIRAEEGDGRRPHLHREDLADRQAGGARAGRGEEETATRSARRGRQRQQRPQHRRGEVAADDHRLAPDRVEEAPSGAGARADSAARRRFPPLPGGVRPVIAKLLYKPFGTILGALAGLLAGAIFKRIWAMVSEEEDAPKATESDYGWSQVVTAAALEGAVFAAVKAVVDRGGAQAFRKLTGVWPGD